MLDSVTSFADKPRILDIDPNSTHAAREWRHWRTIFTNYLDDYKDKIPNKLRALIIYVNPTSYRILWRYRIGTKPAGLNIRKKKHDEVFAHHLLVTRKQRQDELIENFFQILERLRRDSNFKDRTAKQVGDEAVRDGITSPVIW